MIVGFEAGCLDHVYLLVEKQAQFRPDQLNKPSAGSDEARLARLRLAEEADNLIVGVGRPLEAYAPICKSCRAEAKDEDRKQNEENTQV